MMDDLVSNRLWGNPWLSTRMYNRWSWIGDGSVLLDSRGRHATFGDFRVCLWANQNGGSHGQSIFNSGESGQERGWLDEQQAHLLGCDSFYVPRFPCPHAHSGLGLNRSAPVRNPAIGNVLNLAVSRHALVAIHYPERLHDFFETDISANSPVDQRCSVKRWTCSAKTCPGAVLIKRHITSSPG